MNFTSLISAAEEAVAAVKNDRLKEIAFARVLDDLFKNQKLEETAPKLISKHRINASNTKEGPLAWLTELFNESFFLTPKTSRDILEELKKRSHLLKPTDLTSPLQALCHDKKLRREKKASLDGGKSVYHWFNWS